MSAALPPDLAEQTAALADVLEDLLAGWEAGLVASEAARDAVREASHALQQFKGDGLTSARPLEPLEAALAGTSRAVAACGELDRPLLEEALAEIARLRSLALDRLGPGGAPPPVSPLAAAPFRASRGAPALRHGVELPPIALLPPELQLDDEPDDEAAAPAALPLARPVAISAELAQLRELARETMEDLGVLGGLRRPLPDEPWTAPERFEARLLAQLDALFVLSRSIAPERPRLDLVTELYAYVTEWSIPDVARTFALAITLSCIDGEPAARWLLGLLRSSHPRTHEAFIDALTLGASPALAPSIAARLVSSEASDVLIALLEVARRRGDVDPAAVAVLFTHPDTRVVEAVASAAVRLPKAIAVPLLGDLLDAKDERSASAAAESLAVLGSAEGARALRSVLERRVARAEPATDLAALRALRVLALLGAEDDAPLVLAGAKIVPDGLAWLGAFGHPAHAGVLLEAASQSGASAALRGLEHLLGGVWDVDPVKLARDPYQKEQVEAEQRRRRAAIEGCSFRVRRGEPHKGVSTVLAVLADPAVRASDRAGWALELALSSGGERRVPIEDWISRQRALLQTLRSS